MSSLPTNKPLLEALAPTLSTRRVTLRPLQEWHLETFHAILVQPGVRRFLFDDTVIAREDVEAMLARSAQLRRACGTGLWAISENVRPLQLVGWIGLWPYQHRAGAPVDTELVFALTDADRGRGLMHEAGQALLGHARDALGWQHMQATTDDGNGDSKQCLRRLGFVEQGAIDTDAGELRLFRRSL